MIKLGALILLVSLIPAFPASAGVGFADGKKILASCNELMKLLDHQIELDSFEAGRCWGYISASDSLYETVHDGYSRTVCIPEEAEVSGLTKIFVRYLKENPEKLSYNASILLHEAFQKAFPCAQNFQNLDPERRQ
jgi:hypothetical protein